MKLTEEEVRHIANLARLSMSDKEIQYYAKQLSAIFGYVETLNEVNTDGILPTVQVTGLSNVVREDEVIPASEEVRKKIIASFPEKSGDLLKVKAVFES